MSDDNEEQIRSGELVGIAAEERGGCIVDLKNFIRTGNKEAIRSMLDGLAKDVNSDFADCVFAIMMSRMKNEDDSIPS